MSYRPFSEYTLAYSLLLWFIHGAARVIVESEQRIILRQGSWIRMLIALLMVAVSSLWAGCRFHFKLDSLPEAHAVRITEKMSFFHVPWQTKDHGLATVVRFYGQKNSSYLELRAPGRQTFVRLMNMREPLLSIQDAALRLIASRAPGTLELVFSPPLLLPGMGLLVGLLILLIWRPRWAVVESGQLHLHDWAGLKHRRISASQIDHLGIRDADPAGWRTRMHLPERWWVLAHRQDGSPLNLCDFPDQHFAQQWAERAETLLKSGALQAVPTGTYQVWNSKSAL